MELLEVPFGNVQIHMEMCKENFAHFKAVLCKLKMFLRKIPQKNKSRGEGVLTGSLAWGEDSDIGIQQGANPPFPPTHSPCVNACLLPYRTFPGLHSLHMKKLVFNTPWSQSSGFNPP